MRIAAKTDIGSLRDENQDDFRARQFANGDAWAVVCDGMGGARAGRTASRIAQESLARQLEEAWEELDAIGAEAFLTKAVQTASREIFEAARGRADMAGMGTTAAVALVRKGTLTVAHMGDSRIYLARGEKLYMLTKDHSVVQELVESGKITKEEALHHPQRNLITRALGVEPGAVPDCAAVQTRPGDRILLCSDGLTTMVGDEAIRQTVVGNLFFDVPDLLVKLALRAGGMDNITAVLLETEAQEGVG